MKKFIAMLLSVLMITSFANMQGLCVSADANTTKTTTEEITFTNGELLKELALAYDRQGGQVLYDQYNARRSIYSSPEDATAQRTIFLDCSSYVNSCYREAFGVNILPFDIGDTGTSPSTANYDEYAKNNQSASDVVGYWVPADYTTDAERQAVVDVIREEIQIGDILTYRHGKPTSTSNRGHVYMYLGDETLIHCAGAGSYEVNTSNPALSYDSNAGEVKSGGTIGTISFSTIFEDSTSVRYLFKATDSDTVKSFSILRPLVRGLTPTEEAINRMKIAGLSMEKTSSVCENSAVDTGDILTYKVTLENTNSQALSSVEITDTLPTGTNFVSGDSGVTVEGNRLVWNGNVPAKSTVEVKYSVKITANIPGTLIVSDATYVSGVKLGNITHSVSGYSETQRALIRETALKYAQNSKTFSDSLEMAKDIYKSTFDIDVFDYTTADEVLDQLIDTENETRHTSTQLSKILAPNLYGGLDIRYGWLYLPSENDKTRLPKEEHLSVGDIIVADWSKGSTVYLYAGDKTLVTVEGGVCKELFIGDNIYTAGDNIIISLLGYDRYAVLRPSMNSTVPKKDVASIAVATQPTKTSYYNGEVFAPDGMVVKAKMTNGEEIEITSYEVTPEKLVYPQSSVTLTFGGLSTTLNLTVSSQRHPAFASSGYIIDDDFSNTATARPWLVFDEDTDSEDSATVGIENEAIKIVRDADSKLTAKIYFNENKTAITKPTAISFTISRIDAAELVMATNSSQVFTFWYKDGSVRPRRYSGGVGQNVTAGSVGTYAGPITVTYLIDPVEDKYSMWVNGTKEVTDSYLAKTTDINYISVKFNKTIVSGRSTETFTVDNIKVWEFAKEEATCSGTGYNNGNLQAGNIALSLPISYIPNGTDNKVKVIMAAYDKVTDALISMSDIEEHTFDGADFFTFTPEMTIPDSAGKYYVKTMVWKSGTLVPLCNATVLE